MNATYETQLSYRLLDENGDMTFGAPSSEIISGLDAMKQALKTRLAAVKGEWWEGDRTAIPYLPDILGAVVTPRTKDTIDLMVINRIMDTIGVISVSEVNSSISNRRYHFSCNVQTVYGETIAEVNA